MKIDLRKIVLICMLIPLSVFPEESFSQIQSHYISTPIKLDGVLNEAVWDETEPVSDFTQRELTEGATPTEKTEVRVLYDQDNLYIGVICYDSDPDEIIHNQLKWDADLQSDDHFSVVFDTYNDKRMGFLFSVNPNGAFGEGTFRSGQSELNSNWDAIWDVSSRIMDYGWSCEIIIPFKTLRFPNTASQIWGINFKRVIRRKNEELLWRAWGRNDGLMQLSKTGTLSIGETVKSGIQMDVKPYMLGGLNKERGNKLDDTFKYGLDVKYGINSNTTLDVTTKTDFAQIESDKEIINLTRFSLFYPEKRDFFLEGADTFDFTQGGTRLFYSRRIGISPTREMLPILGGAKLTQKTGGYRLGVLTMQTGDAHGFPSANYTVARVKKDVLEQSYIGFIATNIVDTNKHDNQVLGADFGFRTDRFLGNKNFEVQGYLTGSVTDGNTDNNLAGRIFVNYPNDLISSFILYHVIDENFNPEVGFVSRTGIQNFIYTLSISPRPNIPFIKQLVFEPLYISTNTDMGGRPLTRTVEMRPLGIVTDSGDMMNFNIRNEYDYLDQDFSIFKDVVISKGIHEWWYNDFIFVSSRSRRIYGDLRMKWGDYYNGERQIINPSLTLRSNMYFAVSADYRVTRITIGDKKFDAREYGGRIVLDLTTKLSSSTFIQWNNGTNEMNVNFRIHYMPRTGNDIYIVYNHLMDEENEFVTLQNAGMLKVNYTYRF